jgi:hypothetical protein
MDILRKDIKLHNNLRDIDNISLINNIVFSISNICCGPIFSIEKILFHSDIIKIVLNLNTSDINVNKIKIKYFLLNSSR